MELGDDDLDLGDGYDASNPLTSPVSSNNIPILTDSLPLFPKYTALTGSGSIAAKADILERARDILVDTSEEEEEDNAGGAEIYTVQKILDICEGDFCLHGPFPPSLLIALFLFLTTSAAMLRTPFQDTRRARPALGHAFAVLLKIKCVRPLPPSNLPRSTGQ